MIYDPKDPECPLSRVVGVVILLENGDNLRFDIPVDGGTDQSDSPAKVTRCESRQNHPGGGEWPIETLRHEVHVEWETYIDRRIHPLPFMRVPYSPPTINAFPIEPLD